MKELRPDYIVDLSCVIHDPKYPQEDKLEIVKVYFEREIAILNARVEALERMFR